MRHEYVVVVNCWICISNVLEVVPESNLDDVATLLTKYCV